MPAEEIHTKWDATITATEETLTFLRRECGVLDRTWLPYKGMLVPLIRLALDVSLADHFTVLRKWFFSRTFSLEFEVAANTRLVRDYGVLNDAVSSGTIVTDAASGRAIMTATRRRTSCNNPWLPLPPRREWLALRNLDGSKLPLEVATSRGLEATDIVVASIFPRIYRL